MGANTDFNLLENHHAIQRRKVHFDPTINLGHVLTFLGFIVMGFSAYSALDKRVTVIEAHTAQIAERTRDQDARFKETLGEIRADVKDLQRSVNDVNRNLRNTSGPTLVVPRN